MPRPGEHILGGARKLREPVEKRHALRREPDTLLPPREEHHAKRVLQQVHLLAHGRGRQEKPLRRAVEAAAGGHAPEGHKQGIEQRVGAVFLRGAHGGLGMVGTSGSNGCTK